MSFWPRMTERPCMVCLSPSLPLSLSLSLYCSVLPRPLYSIWTLHNQSQIDIMFWRKHHAFLSLSHTHTHRRTAIRPPPPRCQAPPVCVCTHVFYLFVCAQTSAHAVPRRWCGLTASHPHPYTQRIRIRCPSQHTRSVGQPGTRQANVIPAHKHRSIWPPRWQITACYHTSQQHSSFIRGTEHWPAPSPS